MRHWPSRAAELKKVDVRAMRPGSKGGVKGHLLPWFGEEETECEVKLGVDVELMFGTP